MVICSLCRRLNVFRPRLWQSPFAIQRQASPMARGDNYGHLSFYISKTTMSSFIACFQKATMTTIYISKTTMSSVIACLQKATMSSFAFRRQQCLQSLNGFKRRQDPHLHFKDDNIFSYCMPSKSDNALICILKMTMSSVIACLLKATRSSFTFRRR